MPTGSIYFKSCCYTGITYYSSSSYYPTDGGYVSVSGHTLIIPGVYQTNLSATAGVSSINIGAFGHQELVLILLLVLVLIPH
jgi:hypothetical protein